MERLFVFIVADETNQTTQIFIIFKIHNHYVFFSIRLDAKLLLHYKLDFLIFYETLVGNIVKFLLIN